MTRVVVMYCHLIARWSLARLVVILRFRVSVQNGIVFFVGPHACGSPFPHIPFGIEEQRAPTFLSPPVISSSRGAFFLAVMILM